VFTWALPCGWGANEVSAANTDLIDDSAVVAEVVQTTTSYGKPMRLSMEKLANTETMDTTALGFK
jgi:hypothetical protein